MDDVTVVSVLVGEEALKSKVCPLCASFPVYLNVTVNWDDARSHLAMLNPICRDRQTVIGSRKGCCPILGFVSCAVNYLAVEQLSFD